ncbi:MAG: hypothetical protein H7257_02755 [Taibaiella sp.]|nr:hypothetical protein [Taibaiella sp.]
MCIIVDTNTLPSVFDKNSDNHAAFKDVLNWVYYGKGKLVYGGTKYKNELKKYLAIILEYRKAGKAVYVNDADVDAEAQRLASLLQHPDFDDAHLVALLRVSGCRLICSLDSRAYPYFTHNMFFEGSSKKPKIYTGSRNKELLADKYIVSICLPCEKTTKNQRRKLPLTGKS